ncbi:GntR family transcriptional regulator [Cellvibrio sp. PSBB006]|uniref:GntR family transcriptional regulator n=1 Tax=Cellvibrio sp. PSBB006 TaxID=1987723 RepID=UPI000B3B360E|nr:GntR family transcriptional regulator [Cellvibrio sp. PSBB006]ARU27817.1 GntR family transcriptional regulator [Cellvibrio sp. PSBB006]
MFILDPHSDIPIYRQLVEQIKRMIASGQLKKGDALPSVRDLALTHSVNPMTISKAYGLLQREGLLVRQQGKPMQVAALKTRETANKRIERLAPQLEQLILAARQLEVSDQMLLDALSKQLLKPSS